MSFSFNKSANGMESLSELISLISIFLDGGFDLQGIPDWKGLSFVTLLSLFGPFQYYRLGFHSLPAPSTVGLLCGDGFFVAADERLLATAIALKATLVSSIDHTALAPRDLSARRNF